MLNIKVIQITLNNVNPCVDINDLIQMDAYHTANVSEFKAAKEI